MTGDIAENLGAIVVRHESSLGGGALLRSCFDEALKYDPVFVVTLDGDGRYRPEEIPGLLAPLSAGEADVIIGSQSGVQSDFRAYSRDALEVLVNTDGFNVESDVLMIAADDGLRVSEVPVSISENNQEDTFEKQTSSHRIDGLFRILDLVVSERPLMMISMPGVVSLLISVISLGVFLYAYISTGVVSLPLGLLCMASMILGVMFILVALVLYVLKELTVRRGV